MHAKSRLYLSTGLIAGAVALGCQAPPQPAPATPRVVVRDRAMQLTQIAPLTIALDRPCAESEAGYGLAQAPGGLDPRIDHIDVRISGPGMVKAIEFTKHRDDFNGQCELFSDVYDVPPGMYLATFTAIDAKGDVVAAATGYETVDPTIPSTIRLECNFDTGRIVVCVGPCPPPGPSPVPSFSPTPPPPGPFPPIAGLFERIHGLHADDQGNVYLLGLKPKPWPDDIHIGRVVEIEPGGATRVLDRTNFMEHELVFYEGDIAVAPRGGPDLLQAFAGAARKPLTYGNQAYSANTTSMYLRDGAQVVGYANHTIKGDFLRPWGASVGLMGQIIAPGGSGPNDVAGYMIADVSGVVHVDRRSLKGDRRAAVERPISMTMDRVNVKSVVWTSKQGILARGVSHTAPPRVLVNRPAYGITSVIPLRSEVLFTTYEDGDTNVYYADLASGTPPTVAYKFLAGAPHRIERGADGAFYVLLAETPLPFDAASGDPYMYEFPGKKEVRVVKMGFDVAAKKLVEPKLIVDTFQNPTPSW